MARQDLWNYTITMLRSGATQEDLSEKLTEAVAAARKTGKQATLTLQLIIKPSGDGQYELRDKITSRLPELERGMTLMFGTPDGNLIREDPRQKKMDLRSIDDDRPTSYKNAQEH